MMDQSFAKAAKDSSLLDFSQPAASIIALKAAQQLSSQEQALHSMLDLQRPTAASQTAHRNEFALTCMQAFAFDMPYQLSEAVEKLVQTVRQLLEAPHCLILFFNEQTGHYTPLTTLELPLKPISEIPNLTPQTLQQALKTTQPVLQAPLLLPSGLSGLVAIAYAQEKDADFLQEKRLKLETLAPYLAEKVHRFLELRQTQTTPYIQSMVLEVATRMVNAVDQEAILSSILEILTRKLDFNACQYVGFNPETGLGEVLYQAQKSNSPAKSVKVQSFSHAGLEGKRHCIKEFSNLVGLLTSMARNRFYLHLNGRQLDNRSLEDIFGVKNIQSALLLPVVDLNTGEIRGTFNLFRTQSGPISDESREIAIESVQLANQALSRAVVLEKALAMALSDELTGLINRRGYYQRFEAELERARRHQTPLCVALVDVDHFKRFNDTYGHLTGDLVLKTLAELFTLNTRKSDVVCRFGGEEFAILLPDTGLKSATELMERVRQSVENMPLRGTQGEALQVTISIGLTELNTTPKAKPHRSEISDALSIADKALYQAKNSGRNQVCVSPLGTETAPFTQPQAG